MAKGKTSSPLVLVVATQWERHPAVEALRAAGHKVYGYHEPSPLEPDVIFHPAAHNWSEVMFVEDEKKDGTKYRPYLEAAITAGRARKRRKK